MTDYSAGYVPTAVDGFAIREGRSTVSLVPTETGHVVLAVHDGCEVLEIVLPADKARVLGANAAAMSTALMGVQPGAPTPERDTPLVDELRHLIEEEDRIDIASLSGEVMIPFEGGIS